MSEPNFPGHQYFAQPGPAPVPGYEGLIPPGTTSKIERINALVAEWADRSRPYSDDDCGYADGVAHTYHDVVAALRDILGD